METGTPVIIADDKPLQAQIDVKDIFRIAVDETDGCIVAVHYLTVQAGKLDGIVKEKLPKLYMQKLWSYP